ncbi:SANTA domain-containing protein [Vairimorpha necatrix]|uniref:SANTA domain-containing protein n=1 Tax=Vairimorpha necatrix TaxID=6039 RepID=A0AAX4JAA2_9MICR
MNQKEDILRTKEFENLKDYTIFKKRTPRLKRYTRNDKKRLSRWYISFVKNNNPRIKYKYWISINGYLDDNNLIQSSPILNIQGSLVVVTANSLYFLKGNSEIIRNPPHSRFEITELSKFSKGFPNDWEEIIIRQLTEIFGAEKLKTSDLDGDMVLTPFDKLYNKIFSNEEEENIQLSNAQSGDENIEENYLADQEQSEENDIEETENKSEESENISEEFDLEENKNISEDDDTEENKNISEDDDTEENKNISEDDETEENKNISEDDETEENKNISEESDLEENVLLEVKNNLEDKGNLSIRSQITQATLKSQTKEEDSEDIEIVSSSFRFDKSQNKESKFKGAFEKENTFDMTYDKGKLVDSPYEHIFLEDNIEEIIKIEEKSKTKEESDLEICILNTKEEDNFDRKFKSNDSEKSAEDIQKSIKKTAESFQSAINNINEQNSAPPQRNYKTNTDFFIDSSFHTEETLSSGIKLEDIEDKDCLQDSKIIESILSLGSILENGTFTPNDSDKVNLSLTKRKKKEEKGQKKKSKDSVISEYTSVQSEGKSNKSLLEQIMNSRISRPYSYEEVSNKEKISLIQKNEENKTQVEERQKHNEIEILKGPSIINEQQEKEPSIINEDKKVKEEIEQKRVNVEPNISKEEAKEEIDQDTVNELIKIENLKKLYKQNAIIQNQELENKLNQVLYEDSEETRENKSLFVESKNVPTGEVEGNATSSSLNTRKIKKKKGMRMPSQGKNKKKM